MENATLKIFNIKNIDCAHCASKIEAAVAELEEVEEAVLVFATRKFRIKAVHTDELFEKIQKICDDIEPGTLISEEASVVSKHNHHEHHSHHEHSGDCCCGHDHEVHEHSHSHEETEESHSHEHSHGDGESSDLPVVIVGAVLFAAAFIVEKIVGEGIASFIIFAISYIVLGGEILLDALKGIKRGRVFNEKFLMSVATLAAFALKDFPEAAGVMLFFRIGEYFEDMAVDKSRKSIMGAVDMRPESVNLVDGENILTVPAENIKPGEIILVRAGDRIPLDGIVVTGESSIDTSSVTGEHLPENIKPGDSVLSGCVNLQGVIKLEVTKPLSESMVTKIVDSVENAAAGKPKLDRFITRFANIYTPVVVAIAALTAIIPSLITGNWHDWIYTAVTFLVISCPCAIVLSVPLTFFAGIGAGSKKGILFKSGSAIEAVKNIKAVIMDKTGTVTSGTFSINRTDIYSDIDELQLLKYCASCEKNSTHPVAQCIVKKSEELGIQLADADEISEFAGMGMSAIIDGHKILCGNMKLMENNSIDISDYEKGNNGTDIICAVDGKASGCFRISDTIKSDSKKTISELKARGIKTVMLTGDSEASAENTAKETGIDKYYAKLMPEDKLDRMKEVRNECGAVMFVGDGINDAPVLAGSDVSAAMGSGADAAIEAADIVFMNSDMTSLSRAFAISYDTNRIAKQNIVFALAFKLAVMVLGLFGMASMWFAVFADSGVALLCVLNSVRMLKKKY